MIIQHCTRHSECKIGFGDLILLSRYFFRQQLSTDPKQDDKLYAIWLFKEQKYFGHTKILTYSNPDYFALVGTYLLEDELFISGSLTELSDTPELFNSFIENNSAFFKYQMNPDGILIESTDLAFEDFSALNALLKQPLFEIRQVSLEEISC